jgi:5-methylcytosine-specific restriction enzyme A
MTKTNDKKRNGIYYLRPDGRYPKNWNRLRHVIFKRDHYICQMCGRKCDKSTLDRVPNCHHIKPVSKGGNHSWDNLITLCRRCHRKIHGLHR